ncbi:MAG: Putative flagellar hook-associated protein 2 [Synergistales bacterium 54_24]|nr:MAG: Putative flagellar hook-associated protein 2 [Synergistales bacterium 54_24]
MADYTAPLFQVTGLASGIDWGQMIDKMMEAARKPEEFWQAEKDTLELKVGLYNEFSAYLKTLRSSISPLKLSGTFTAKEAELTPLSPTTDPSSVLAITATPEAEINRYEIEVLQKAAAEMRISNPLSGILGDADITDSYFYIKVGDMRAKVNLHPADTLSDVAARINEAVDESTDEALPIQARVFDNRLVIESTQTGTEAAFSLEDEYPQGTLAKLGLDLDDPDHHISAQDAKLVVDGVSVTRSSNEISDLIQGLTLNINGVGKVRADIVLDAQNAVESIQSFVEAYNDTMDWINVRLQEEKVKEPKSELEAQRGLLRGDSILWQAKAHLRQIVANPLSLDGFSQLSQIGITTESIDYGKSGKLEFDTDKFMAAMTEDPQSVADLVNGVANKFESYLANMVDAVPVAIGGSTAPRGRVPSQIQNLQEQIRSIDKRIADFEERLSIRQRGLYEQFSQMENTLAQLNQQASWLASVLGILSSANTASNS